MDLINQQQPVHEFCEMMEESEQMMSPIQGYAKMPLVSLEKAVEPLVSIVPDVKRMVWTVKQICKDSADNLSPDESASILLYTLNWHPPENAIYYNLNKTLRNPDRTLLKPWLLYLKLVVTALSKMPSEQRRLWRGVKEDVSDRYVQGQTYVWWGFSSCTATIDVLKNDLFLGKTGMRTIFVIDCHSGKDISRHSMHKNENEVLLLPARQFRVVSSLNQNNGLNIIQIEEIDPLHPLLEPIPMNDLSISVKLLSKNPLIKRSVPYHNPELEQSIHKCSSRKINLMGQQLNDQDMAIITQQAMIDKQCVMLDLTYNEVTQHGACILANTLCNNIYLEELNISHNSISDEGVRYLALGMNSSVLKRINLEVNDISNEGAKYLAEMFTSNVSLVQLSLGANRISSVGMNVLANALTQTNTRLETLNLSANVDIDDESIASLIEMLKNNRSLKKLDLRRTNLSKDATKRLQTEAKSKKGFELWLFHFT